MGIRYPDFRVPSKIVGVPFGLGEIQKRRNVHSTGLAPPEMPFELDMPLERNGIMRGHRLNQKDTALAS